MLKLVADFAIFFQRIRATARGQKHNVGGVFYQPLAIIDDLASLPETFCQKILSKFEDTQHWLQIHNESSIIIWL